MKVRGPNSVTSTFEREFEFVEALDLTNKPNIQSFDPFVLHFQSLEEFIQPRDPLNTILSIEIHHLSNIDFRYDFLASIIGIFLIFFYGIWVIPNFYYLENYKWYQSLDLVNLWGWRKKRIEEFILC